MFNREKPVRRSHRFTVKEWDRLAPNSARGAYGYPGSYSGSISQQEISAIARSDRLYRSLRGGREERTAGEEAEALRDQSYEREQLADLVGWVDGPHPVVSTWCEMVGYFVARGERGIAIEFRSRVTCFYVNTSTALYDQLLAVSSKGKFVHQFLAHHAYIIIG